ncbi:MAG TPA: UDP-N-acetylmuramoyl-L-alanine--D-glutamate ligase [Planctomycetota bacterium]|nr:UDP-N-acetylmuramoyl-L-alanine--D-glutamate ligase [Planctomycetota bacterium]
MALTLAGRSVVVWGIGRHWGGVAAADFCEREGARVELLDAKPASELGAPGAEVVKRGWTAHVGDASHPTYRAADLIVASPAIAPRALPADGPPVTSPEALFFAAHRGPRVCVTGTKGKSTTANIAATLLGWPVGGNSYEPLLMLLARHGPDVGMVCELSSFQLWYLRDERPRVDVAVLTTLAVDHLDWHPDLAHYRAAKLSLFGWSRRCVAAGDLRALLPGDRLIEPVACDGDSFRDGAGALARRDDLPLPGAHNAANAGLAIAAARELGLDRALVAERLRDVRALPHRLEPVARGDRHRFIDDSIATTPESAMAAMASFTGEVAIILGGSDKGASYVELAGAVARRGARPVLLGQTAPRIAAALQAHGIDAPRAGDMDDAVRLAVAALPQGGTVLLSPACASFDLFRGFEHRGDCFRAAAQRAAQGG